MGGVNKFKVGDVVKCVDSSSLISLTTEKEYIVIKTCSDDMIVINDDKGEFVCYYSCRFELSEGGTTTSSQTQQPPKFKEGDVVYLIGFDCLKPHKLLKKINDDSPMKFKVEVVDDVFETFTEYGKYLTSDVTPRIVLATEENRLMLNKLLGVEYEPVKLKGSDLAKKILKDKPQICRVSDISDDYASSNNCFDLVVKFENGVFITMSGIRWVHAVPCNQHGRILEDE